MSLTSRARHLSTIAGLTHQQAVNAIRASGPAPAQLATDTNWPLRRADVFIHDPMLDQEYASAWSGSRSVAEEDCENCNARFFVGYDKKGYSDGPFNFCPSCIEEHGLDHCPRCGCEILGVADGPCESCWSDVISRDD